MVVEVEEVERGYGAGGVMVVLWRWSVGWGYGGGSVVVVEEVERGVGLFSCHPL